MLSKRPAHQGVALLVLANHQRRVWADIPLEEVRARIKDMPARCQELIETGGVQQNGDITP